MVEEAAQQAWSRASCEAEGVAYGQISLEMPVEVGAAAHCAPPPIQGSATPASV
jgi:hypothetical protein